MHLLKVPRDVLFKTPLVYPKGCIIVVAYIYTYVNRIQLCCPCLVLAFLYILSWKFQLYWVKHKPSGEDEHVFEQLGSLRI